MVTQARLKEVLYYDPATGLLTRPCRVGSRGRKCGGRELGCISNESGYRLIRIDYRLYRASRLAWMFMTGAWPTGEIDHINMDRSDNRWCNLREATGPQNRANTRVRSHNTSGFKGVTRDKERDCWIGQLTAGSKHHFLGRFDCPAAAHFAYITAADKAFGEFARGA